MDRNQNISLDAAVALIHQPQQTVNEILLHRWQTSIRAPAHRGTTLRMSDTIAMPGAHNRV